MGLIIEKRYLELNDKLVRHLNSNARDFNEKSYSQIQKFDDIIAKRDISIERKKSILMKKLYHELADAFSIDSRKLSRNSLDSLGKRLQSIRKLVMKLRDINHFLETVFLRKLKSNGIIPQKAPGVKSRAALGNEELELLEYTTYKLIEEVIILNKTVLREYGIKNKNILITEKNEIKHIEELVVKEGLALEHLEAKLPPARALSLAVVKEPSFTHWIGGIFALLSLIGYLYEKECSTLKKLKRHGIARMMVGKKIAYLIREQSKLIKIMQDKYTLMKRFKMEDDFRKELHNLKTIITV